MSLYDSDRSLSPPSRRPVKVNTRIIYGLPDELGASDRRVICRAWLQENYPRLMIYSGKLVDNLNVLPVIGINCTHRRGVFTYDQADKDELIRFVRHHKDYYGEQCHEMGDTPLTFMPVMYGNFRELSRTYTLDDY